MGSFVDFRSFGEGTEVAGNARKSQGYMSSLPLARQSSIYSLTFDELQTSFSGFGKDFGSLNMDELLKTVWTAEETQVTSTTVAVGGGEGSPAVGGLQKQGSLTLPRTLSQKTVDQVWKDLYNEGSTSADNGRVDVNFQQRQSTLGEMTLEDFLLKAGVVKEDAQLGGTVNNHRGFYDVPNDYSSVADIGFHQPGLNSGASVYEKSLNNFGVISKPTDISMSTSMSVTGPSQQEVQAVSRQCHPLFPNPTNVTFSSPTNSTNNAQLPTLAPKTALIGMTDKAVNNNGYSTQNVVTGIVSLRNGTLKVPIEPPPKKMALENIARNNNLDLSPLAPSPYGFSPVTRGRKSNTGVEKVVERRHRRMIKNRESAARSRARKQAYTLELEAEIKKLREVNEELHKKQEEIMEDQKEEIIEKVRLQWGGKRVCLRRTLTGPW